MEASGRLLMIAGIVVFGLGLLLASGVSVPWLGRLPGDIRIDRPGMRIFIPITSSILVSIALSALIWIVQRVR